MGWHQWLGDCCRTSECCHHAADRRHKVEWSGHMAHESWDFCGCCRKAQGMHHQLHRHDYWYRMQILVHDTALWPRLPKHPATNVMTCLPAEESDVHMTARSLTLTAYLALMIMCSNAPML